MSARKPCISPTQLEMYLRCAEAWRRRYIEGEKLPPSVPLARGRGLHAGAAQNFGQKIISHEDLPAEKVAAAAVDDVEAVIRQEGLYLSPEESSIGSAKVIGAVKDSVARLARTFVQQIAPRIQPAFVEKLITIPVLDCTHDLKGRIDVATEGDCVVDLKSSNKRMTQDQVDRSDQLTFYDAAFEYEMDRDCQGVSLEVLVGTKKPRVQSLRRMPSPRDRRILLAKINTMLAGIKAGIFLPAAPGAWWCSPKYCGYAQTCSYFDAERKAAAEGIWE